MLLRLNLVTSWHKKYLIPRPFASRHSKQLPKHVLGEIFQP